MEYCQSDDTSTTSLPLQYQVAGYNTMQKWTYGAGPRNCWVQQLVPVLTNSMDLASDPGLDPVHF